MVGRAAKTELEHWTVRANTSDGIYIKCPESSFQCPHVSFEAIVAPPQLDKSLTIGWQHSRHASRRNRALKEDIAEQLISILTKSELAGILSEDEDTESRQPR